MARRRRSDEEPRTFSIWGFAAAFVVLGVLGLLGVIAAGSSKSGTVQLPAVSTTTTVGDGTGDATDPSDDASSSVDGGTAAPVTMPDGSPAPAGVTEVVASSGGLTSYAFAVPEQLGQVPIRAVVAPATATPSPDGGQLAITVTCAGGVGEALAQLSVTEESSTVTILPVALVPAESAPCAPEDVLQQVTVPLAAPLGARRIVFVPAGTSVPTPTPG